MFELEKAIAAWLSKLQHSRIYSAEDIEELESHLRDNIDALISSGQSEEAALSASIRRMGDFGNVEAEYRKVLWLKTRYRYRTVFNALQEIAFVRSNLQNALPNLLQHKAYSAINVSSLAIGMAVCMLTILYVKDQLRYDAFHDQSDNIYRLVTDSHNSGKTTQWAYSWSGWGPRLQNEFPEVNRSVRFSRTVREQENLVRYGDKLFREGNVFHADPAVFEVFTLPLVRGIVATALRAPHSVVISQEIALKYFGEMDPLYKTLSINEEEYSVTGVFETTPSTSHIDFDLLISMATQDADPDFVAYGSFWMYTYLLLEEGASPDALADRLPQFVEQYTGEANPSSNLLLQPLTSIHLHSDRRGEIGPGGNAATLYIFSLISLLILTIACTNFMNLATAHLANRARETGLVKILRDRRRQVLGQFLGEAVLLSVVAATIAVFGVRLAAPIVSELAGTTITVGSPLFVVALALVALGLGVVSGSYPALFISAFRPLAVLLDTAQRRFKDRVIQRGLVALQFVVCIALIIGTGIIYQQLDYFHSKKPGFDRDQVISLSAAEMVATRYETFRESLLEDPRIKSVTASSNRMGERVWSWSFRPEGWEKEQDDWVAHALLVDYDFLETFGIRLSQGRDFSRAIEDDMGKAILLNQKAATVLGWADPVGKRIDLPDTEHHKISTTGTVIGVVEDFHYASLHEEVAPLVIVLSPELRRHIAVRVNPVDLPTTITFIEEVWLRFESQHPMEYALVDEEFSRLHIHEERLGEILRAFSLVTILVAGLGLLGLASLIIEERTGEIGIRKALGASVVEIVFLLSKEFVRPIIVAFVLAVPLAYFAVSWWLESFVYRIEISWPVFLIAGLVVVGIATIVVSFQAFRAALTEPVDVLRYQ